MRKILNLKNCALAALLAFVTQASAQTIINQNNLILNGGLDSGSSYWGFSGGGGYWYPNGGNGEPSGTSYVSIGWWDGCNIYQNTGATFQPGINYVLTMRAAISSAPMTGVRLALQDVSQGYANVTNTALNFSAGQTSFQTFAMFISSNTIAGNLGDTIAVSGGIYENPSSQNGWLNIDWVQLAPALPYFTSQPVGITNFAGASATFSVSAIGAVTNSSGPGSAILYQWYQGSTAIPNATNASYTIPVLNATNAGNYSVVATDPYGSSQSASATLGVLPANPPIVTQAPVSQSAYLHQTVQFSVAVSGTPLFGYQWTSNSVPLAGATNATLILNNISAASAGTYSVTITNAFGSATTNATLTVITPDAGSYEADIIAQVPQVYLRFSDIGSTNLVENEGVLGASASAVAEGNYVATTGPIPPSYPNFESTNPAVQFDGASADVVIPPLNLATNTGNTVTLTAWIYCYGTEANYAGIVFARDNGASGLQIQADANGNNILSYDWANGSRWQFQSGLIIPQYQWCFTALVITPTNATLYLQNGTSLQTAVDNVAEGLESFTGDTWIGWDPAGGASGRRFSGIIDETTISSQALTPTEVNSIYAASVGAPPAVVTDPVGVTNYTGSAFALSPVISGAPPLSFQWYKNNTPVVGATNNNYSVASATTTDTGSYYLHISNTAGSTNTDPVAVLITTSAPYFTGLPQATNAWTGVPTTLTAAAVGSLPITYQWYANNQALSGQTNTSLTIADPEATTGYVLRVSNAFGSTNSPAVNLMVQDPAQSAQMLYSTNGSTYQLVSGTGNPTGDYSGDFFTTGAKARTVTHLGYFDATGNGLYYGHNVGVFQGSSLVASVYVPPGTGPSATNGWRWVPLAQPITLLPNTTYSIWGDTNNTTDVYPNTFAPDWNTAYVGTNQSLAYLSWNWDASPPFVFPDYPTYRQVNIGWNAGQAFGNVNLGSFPMTMTQAGSAFQINWSLGTLESATNLAGPYTAVSGATSPYTMPLSGPAQFYRVQY